MSIIAGNDILRVAVQDSPGIGAGVYVFATQDGYPAGGDLSILYGGSRNDPGTSYNTYRSYTSQTDYIQLPGSVMTDPGYTVNPISTLSETLPLPTGARTTYTIESPDSLKIVQDVLVHGVTYANSYIELTNRITNTGATPVTMGVRYLWDYQLGTNDGPTFQQLNPPGPVLNNEATYAPPDFKYYKMNTDGDPTFAVKGFSGAPSPDMLQYAQWGAAAGIAFSYNTSGMYTGDSAVVYYWGRTAGIEIPAGKTLKFTALVFSGFGPVVQGSVFGLREINPRGGARILNS